MHSRPVARSQTRLSEISLGTWGLGAKVYGPVTSERFIETVRAAFESGVRTFDVSPTWGDSEQIVARALGANKGECTFITRGGARVQGTTLHTSTAPELLRVDLEGSLECLGVERIDVWLLNHPDARELGSDETLRFLEDARAQGKIAHWGVSTSTAAVAQQALRSGGKAVCAPYHLLQTSFMDGLAADLATTGAAFLARSPLSYGLLAGTWQDTQSFMADDHRGRRWSPAALKQRVHASHVLSYLARGEIKTVAEAALRWTLMQPLVTTTIVGARSPAQIREAARAADGPPYLPEDDMMRIPQLLAALGL